MNLRLHNIIKQSSPAGFTLSWIYNCGQFLIEREPHVNLGDGTVIQRVLLAFQNNMLVLRRIVLLALFRWLVDS
jgi:hypothetical protein